MGRVEGDSINAFSNVLLSQWAIVALWGLIVVRNRGLTLFPPVLPSPILVCPECSNGTQQVVCCEGWEEEFCQRFGLFRRLEGHSIREVSSEPQVQ